MSDPIPSWNYNPILRQSSFDSTVDSPGSWLFSALDLKTAADRIDWRRKPVRDDEPSVGLHRVYRMLIGMSMESLLKGILVAQGEQILNAKGKLGKDFTIHDLCVLAGRVDDRSFQFSEQDLKILRNLKPFIEWAGRYPLPISASGLIVVGHSSTEVIAEAGLWDRLYKHLITIGWVSKGGGKRLYFDRSRYSPGEQGNSAQPVS